MGGITLIALVITIIILLILAGISIATLTGENGLLGKAKNSAILTQIARNGGRGKFNLYRFESRRVPRK